jgi:hypothetical protein
MKNRTFPLETRIRILEKQYGDLYAAFMATRRIDGVDELAYRRAINALAQGDSTVLDAYLKRGGKIPIREQAQEGRKDVRDVAQPA